MEIKVELLVSLIVTFVLVILVVIICRYVICPRVSKNKNKKKYRYTKLRSTGSTKLTRYSMFLSSLQGTIATNRTRSKRAEQTDCSNNNHNKLPQLVVTECYSAESSSSEFETTSTQSDYQHPVGLITYEHERRFKSEPILNSEYTTSPDKQSDLNSFSLCNKLETTQAHLSVPFVENSPQTAEEPVSTRVQEADFRV